MAFRVSFSVLAILHTAAAVPTQIPLQTAKFDPLLHLSGIAPYHDAPGASILPPAGCRISAAGYLVRHSSIYANDDEWEETIKPFTDKLEAIPQSSFPKDPEHPFYFLNGWQSPITEDNLEEVAPSGKHDARELGKGLRDLYPHLLPKKWVNKKDGKKPMFKVWTASSSRDIESAKAFMKGAFPRRMLGDGSGDGDQLQLIKVPNKDAPWAGSLTPHKICPAFSKEPSREPATQWLSVYAPAIRDRLSYFLPEALKLDNQDVLAMQMLCGYETVARGSSPWCDVMEEEDWRSAGYYYDIRYHYMVGYGSKLSPYLGMPWLNSTTHLLLTSPSDPKHPHAASLPTPRLPPNATHSQSLHVFFTHREEPPLVLTALGLFNHTHEAGEWNPPLDRIDRARAWHTSHILPFLGHVALERMTCVDPSANGKEADEIETIRVVVNGAVHIIPGCKNGIEQSCLIDDFAKYVQTRMEMYGDIEGVCKKD